MNTLRSLFSTHEDVAQIILYATVITSLWLAELIISADDIRSKFRHSSVNLAFIFTALPVQLSLTTFIIIICKWANIHHWGLLNLVHWLT